MDVGSKFTAVVLYNKFTSIGLLINNDVAKKGTLSNNLVTDKRHGSLSETINISKLVGKTIFILFRTYLKVKIFLIFNF